MKREKRTLDAALILLLGVWIWGGASIGNAQSSPAVDLSNPTLRDQVRSSGFIASGPIPSLGSIEGSRDESGYLSEGDLVYIKLKPGQAVKSGDRYYMARWGDPVNHPVTREKAGNIVRISGRVAVLDGKGPVVPAKIERSFFQVRYGDLIVAPGPDLPPSVSLRFPPNIEGIVLASSEWEENITQQVAVYIDRGSQAGVITGDVFSIYKLPYYTKEAKENNPNLPLLKVGEGVAILVSPETSTLMITQSYEAIHVGNLVVSGRAK